MFEVSEEASEKIGQFLEGSEGPLKIRILMTEGGWRGPYLVMALDEQKQEDEVFIDRGVTFLVEKTLFEKVKPIRIGYTHSTLGAGYTITSELPKLAMNVLGGCDKIYHCCGDIPK
jgi:iron-sulfur cluster assembly protein